MENTTHDMFEKDSTAHQPPAAWAGKKTPKILKTLLFISSALFSMDYRPGFSNRFMCHFVSWPSNETFS